MPFISELITRMIALSEGNLHDITHFMTVWGYARTIGELEGLAPEAQFILEAAAVTHDIACPYCRAHYGSTAPALQEREGERMVRALLSDDGLPAPVLERICLLVGHHHQTSDLLGDDHRILIEADLLVNAMEAGAPAAQIADGCRPFFRTASGLRLLDSLTAQEKQPAAAHRTCHTEEKQI